MKTRLKLLINELDKYADYTLKDNIDERLNKTLMMYLNDLDRSSSRIIAKKRKDIVAKELNR